MRKPGDSETGGSWWPRRNLRSVLSIAKRQDASSDMAERLARGLLNKSPRVVSAPDTAGTQKHRDDVDVNLQKLRRKLGRGRLMRAASNTRMVVCFFFSLFSLVCTQHLDQSIFGSLSWMAPLIPSPQVSRG